MARPASWLLLLLLAACARSEDASVVANSNDLKAVEQVRTAEQDDEEIALGNWRETLQDEFAALEFGPTGAPPLFSLRCDARHSVYLQRHGAVPSGDLPTMLVSVGSDTRRLAVTGGTGTVPMLRAALAPSDELIRTLSSATAPIVVRVGDSAPLVLPPSPAIGTFLSRCGTGESSRTSAAAAGNESVPAANAAAPSGNAAAPAAPPQPQR